MLNSTEKAKYFFGSQTSELVILKELFGNYSDYYYWKVELMMLVLYEIDGDYVDVNTTLFFSTIQKPYNGSCTVYPTKGFALMTDFYISCEDWKDVEGFIAAYEHYGKLFCFHNFYLLL